MKDIRHVGLDVDSEKVVVAVAEPEGEVRSLGAIPDTQEAVRRLVKRLGPARRLRVCYEAGPHGYGLYWQLTQLGAHCDVIAPTLIPTRSGDRVKTNRRDAEKLARCYRSGDLTAVWVPDAAHEALRDVVRARESAKKDQLRARHRLGKFLLRHGLRAAASHKSWTVRHLDWVRTLHFEPAAQEAAFLDYLHEVEHAAERVGRLERAIDQAVAAAPTGMRAVIAALQALRGRLGLPAPPQHLGRSSQAPGRPHRGSQGDRLEGAASTELEIPAPERQGKAAAEDHCGDRPRTARLHLGDRGAGRKGAAATAGSGTSSVGFDAGRAEQATVERQTGRRILAPSMWQATEPDPRP